MSVRFVEEAGLQLRWTSVVLKSKAQKIWLAIVATWGLIDVGTYRWPVDGTSWKLGLRDTGVDKTCSRVRWFESQKIDHFCLFLRPSASPSYLLLQFLSILHEKLLGILGRSFRVYPTIREFTYANIHGGDSSEKRTPLWNHGSSQDWKFYMILKAIYMIENWTLILYKSTENLMQSFYSSLKGSFTPFSLLTMAVTSWHFSASVVPQPNNQPLCRVLYIVFECALLACYCACVICCDMGVTSALESSC